MYEYEINITVEDENNNQHIIKKYIVCSIMGKSNLKEHIEELLSKDFEISQYKIINYNIINWDEVAC